MVLGTCKIRVNQICTSVDKMSINLGSSYFFFFFKRCQANGCVMGKYPKKKKEMTSDKQALVEECTLCLSCVIPLVLIRLCLRLVPYFRAPNSKQCPSGIAEKNHCLSFQIPLFKKKCKLYY